MIHQLVQEGQDAGYIEDDTTKSELLRLLLLKHKFVDATPGGMSTTDGGASMGARLKRTLTKASMAVSTKLDYPKTYKSVTPIYFQQGVAIGKAIYSYNRIFRKMG